MATDIRALVGHRSRSSRHNPRSWRINPVRSWRDHGPTARSPKARSEFERSDALTSLATSPTRMRSRTAHSFWRRPRHRRPTERPGRGASILGCSRGPTQSPLPDAGAGDQAAAGLEGGHFELFGDYDSRRADPDLMRHAVLGKVTSYRASSHFAARVSVIPRREGFGFLETPHTRFPRPRSTTYHLGAGDASRRRRTLVWIRWAAPGASTGRGCGPAGPREEKGGS